MNLLVTTNTKGVCDAVLPPRRSNGRFRLLILTIKNTGLRSIGLEYEKFCAERDDIEAVSVLFSPPRWLKAIGHTIPGCPGYDFSCERTMFALRQYLGVWFRFRLPLERFDAVHCTQQYIAQGVLDHRPRHTAVSVHIDATQMNNVEEWNDHARFSRAMVADELQIFGGADIIASSSSWASSSLVRNYGVPEHKIVEAPPTSDLLPRPDLDPTIAPPPSCTRKPRILFVGHNWDRKGGPELLRWHQVRWRDTAELHVVSGEITGPPLPGVVFHGSVPRQKLITEIFPSCDVFCIPTKRDCSPWVITEAQAAGLPVVAPRLAGIPDQLRHGQTGFLVEQGDEADYIARLELLLNNPVLARQMSRDARAFAARTCSRDVVFGRITDALRAAAAARSLPTTIAPRRSLGAFTRRRPVPVSSVATATATAG